MTAECIPLPSGGSLELVPLLDPAEARDLKNTLETALPWQQREIVLFGKRILQPRLIAWCGALPYRYSGQTLPPRPCPRPLATIIDRVERIADAPFNHVLGNWYRNGEDSMGYHSDDEPELGPAPVVASLSLGARRRFVLRSRVHRREPSRTVELGPGVVLIMRPPCQATYRHGLPRVAGLSEDRMSLTFRRVLCPPGARVPPGT